MHNDYGYDEGGPAVTDDSEEGVHVPKSSLKFNQADIDILMGTINPTAPSNEYGMELTYIKKLLHTFCASHVHQYN